MRKRVDYTLGPQSALRQAFILTEERLRAWDHHQHRGDKYRSSGKEKMPTLESVDQTEGYGMLQEVKQQDQDQDGGHYPGGGAEDHATEVQTSTLASRNTARDSDTTGGEKQGEDAVTQKKCRRQAKTAMRKHQIQIDQLPQGKRMEQFF